MSADPDIAQRLRIMFGKQGGLRFISHLDLIKVWERSLRRADLPVLYTKGFNARPRIQLALALPLGFTSECEYLDVFLREAVKVDGLSERLTSKCPTGLYVIAVEEVAPEAVSLEHEVERSSYEINFVDSINPEVLRSRVAKLLSQQTILKIETNRRGRKSAYDLRALVFSLEVRDANTLVAQLATGTRGNLRPDTLLQELELADRYTRIHRLRLYFRDEVPQALPKSTDPQNTRS